MKTMEELFQKLSTNGILPTVPQNWYEELCQKRFGDETLGRLDGYLWALEDVEIITPDERRELHDVLMEVRFGERG